jgi:protein required for attachment to host cells
MSMQTTWIVAADSSRARIFEMQGLQDPVREIEDFANPAGREQDRELSSDARGRYYGKGEGQQAHTAEPHVDEVEHQTELFSKRVGEYLDQARVEHRYDKLCLIAFPKFLGLLRQNLSKEARRLVEDEVPKDISKLEARDIEDYVKNRLH